MIPPSPPSVPLLRGMEGGSFPLVETSSHVPQGGICPMLSFTESIRPTTPSMQRGCRAVADARACIELLLVAWALARILAIDIVAAVLTARAPCPTSWLPALRVGRLYSARAESSAR